MLTCVAGWLPSVTAHLLICADGCAKTPQDFSPTTLFDMHAISYGLLIAKSFCNPLIFALR